MKTKPVENQGQIMELSEYEMEKIFHDRRKNGDREYDPTKTAHGPKHIEANRIRYELPYVELLPHPNRQLWMRLVANQRATFNIGIDTLLVEITGTGTFFYSFYGQPTVPAVGNAQMSQSGGFVIPHAGITHRYFTNRRINDIELLCSAADIFVFCNIWTSIQ